MCGLVGIVDFGNSGNLNHELLTSLTDTLEHRGPDDAGVWLEQDRSIGLGHRRLSILDVSSGGHQPMISRDGRLVIAYNGEVYNFKQIRQELIKAGSSFQGGSDTEVILEAIRAWGLRRAISQFNGMFASRSGIAKREP